jgi:hypothetical protein
MQVRLTRKLAETIDGIDLSSHEVGDVFDLPAAEAQLLLAEEWADLHIAEVYVGEFGGAAERVPGAHGAEASDPYSSTRTLDRISQIRRQLEQRRFGRNERRRAEDRYREELRDSRARTIGRS